MPMVNRRVMIWSERRLILISSVLWAVESVLMSVTVDLLRQPEAAIAKRAVAMASRLVFLNAFTFMGVKGSVVGNLRL